MTRLETFCDAAFAFAVTLPVISGGSIPASYAAPVEALTNVPAFLVSFAAIALTWVAQRRWSRRCGLEDGWTTLISLTMPLIAIRSARVAERLAGRRDVVVTKPDEDRSR